MTTAPLSVQELNTMPTDAAIACSICHRLVGVLASVEQIWSFQRTHAGHKLSLVVVSPDEGRGVLRATVNVTQVACLIERKD